MEDLLFLSHRIPYPPDKGDKIRAFHVLRHLSKRFRIHLGCFYDDPHDAQYVGELEKLCETVLCLPLSKSEGLIKGGFSLLSGHSLSEGYFGSSAMRNWVDRTIGKYNPANIFVFCSAMAPYALPHISGRTSLLDLVDADSEKWRAYAAEAIWPLSAFYKAEYRALNALERRAALSFSRSFFVSADEASLFLQDAAEAVDNVGYFGNGVDFAHFDPAISYPNPFSVERRPIVFTGRMDYAPNIQACLWFAREVLPIIQRAMSDTEFWIVGAQPVPALTALEESHKIRITGRVEDMRPYLSHAACVVAPLKIARGIQNKVLEAMAMAKAVVATPEACTGIDAHLGEELLCASGPEEFAATVLRVLQEGGDAIGTSARARVVSTYCWPDQLRPLDAMLNDKTETGDNPEPLQGRPSTMAPQ